MRNTQSRSCFDTRPDLGAFQTGGEGLRVTSFRIGFGAARRAGRERLVRVATEGESVRALCLPTIPGAFCEVGVEDGDGQSIAEFRQKRGVVGAEPARLPEADASGGVVDELREEGPYLPLDTAPSQSTDGAGERGGVCIGACGIVL